MTTPRRTRRLTAGLLAAMAACAAIVFACTAEASGSQTAPPHHLAASAPPSSLSSAPDAQSARPAPSTSTSAPAAAASTRPDQPVPSHLPALAPSQLPAVQAEQWTKIGSASNRAVGGHGITENECAKVVGAQTWTQQGYSGAAGRNVATQDTFTFTGSAAARSAYRTFFAEMADCQTATREYQETNKITPDALVIRTATVGNEAGAWERTWTGVMGLSAGGPQTNHYYAAVDGKRLIVLQFTEFPGHSVPYSSAADPRVLATLTAELTD